MKHFLCHAFIIAFFAAGSTALAADDPPKEPKPAPVDPSLTLAREAIAHQDWKAAAEVLQKALERNPSIPAYHNLYAYSMRMGPNPGMDLVFKHYNEALRLDPQYRAAHEYIGEAYLMVGNLAKAKEHLGVLDKLCGASCDERAELGKAIAGYEAKGSR